MKDSTLVGVYGSLRKTLHNHYLLQNAEFVGNDALPAEYSMHSLGGLPGVCKGGDTSIVLELYRVTDEERDRLDQLEGHPDWYKREEVPTVQGNMPFVYFLTEEEIGQQPVVDGDWKAYHDNVHGEYDYE